MKLHLIYLLFLGIGYMAFGWPGVYWSMVGGVFLWYGLSEIAKKNWKQVRDKIKEDKS